MSSKIISSKCAAKGNWRRRRGEANVGYPFLRFACSLGASLLQSSTSASSQAHKLSHLVGLYRLTKSAHNGPFFSRHGSNRRGFNLGSSRGVRRPPSRSLPRWLDLPLARTQTSTHTHRHRHCSHPHFKSGSVREGEKTNSIGYAKSIPYLVTCFQVNCFSTSKGLAPLLLALPAAGLLVQPHDSFTLFRAPADRQLDNS